MNIKNKISLQGITLATSLSHNIFGNIQKKTCLTGFVSVSSAFYVMLFFIRFVLFILRLRLTNSFPVNLLNISSTHSLLIK